MLLKRNGSSPPIQALREKRFVAVEQQLRLEAVPVARSLVFILDSRHEAEKAEEGSSWWRKSSFCSDFPMKTKMPSVKWLPRPIVSTLSCKACNEIKCEINIFFLYSLTLVTYIYIYI
jgi:hypothetical protein